MGGIGCKLVGELVQLFRSPFAQDGVFSLCFFWEQMARWAL